MKTTETMEGVKKEENKQTSSSALVMISATLFAIVCAISTFLFFENTKLTHSIEANKNEITTYVSSIEKIRNDKKIIAAELVSNNKAEILKSIQRSEAQRYITELQDVAKKYKMIFSGFAYGNGKITTSAVSIPETILANDDGIKKISNLIKDYRTESGSIFQLSPVLSISGHEQKRAFSIEFNVDAKDIQ